MKNLTKIFMAVVAGMLAFACTTDSTEDLGVQVGNGTNGENGAIVELSLSLETSRTQLGEKVDGLYPLYWSEGDKISVNGVESGEAVINTENPASAVFAVAEAETYAVAYPAAPVGQVLFAAEQNHVVEGNTFASGVSTMYGYSEDRNSIQLNHLTGVLKIGVKGEAILSKAQISTIDRAPIAGAFDIDFQTGELEATATSKDVIEYSFGEGLQLTSEAQYIYVAVPAGKYDELYITLYEKGNSGNIMYATVKAGESKPLTAGNVREFKSAIVYVPNAQAFVINSVEQLQAFKAAVEASTTLAIDAIFTEDIDMTGVEWTPINGPKYINTVHGNGYAIKGLTAPLFNQTSATIKGLHLVDVNIETNITNAANRFYGALVCSLKPAVTGETKVAVENCSVSGTILINNPNYPTNQNLFLGGVVGAVYGGVVDSCVGRVNITASKMSVDGIAKSFAVGGVVGLATNSGTVYSAVNNSKNEGVINIQPEAGTINAAYIAGVVAYSQETNPGINMSNCENHGNITFKGTAKNAYVSGVSGYAAGIDDETAVKGNIENAVNNGKITVKSGSSITSLLSVAGIAGIHTSSHIINSENNGEIDVESGVSVVSVYAAGIAGSHITQNDKGSTNGKHDIRNCVNNAAINCGASSANETTSSALKIGGISGYSQGRIYDSTNNGTITISGNLNVNTPAGNDYKKGTFSVGGVIGYKTVGRIYGNTNHGDIIFSANLTNIATSGQSQICIAGHTGYLSQNLNAGTDSSQSAADGKVIISGNTTGCQMCIAGLVGHIYKALSNQSCAAKIEISGTHTGNLIVGGLTSANVYGVSNLTFNGSIDVKADATISGECYVAGCVALLRGINTTQIKGTDLTNNGTVNFAGSISGNTPHIIGCVGVSEADSSVTDALHPTLTNITNNGDVTFSGSVAGGEGVNSLIAGCVGRSRGKLTTAENSGTITFAANASEADNQYMGGVVGVMNNIAEGAVNNGEIKAINGAQYTKLHMAGVFGNISGLGSSQKYTNCVNNGTISYSATNEEAGLKALYMGGVTVVSNAHGYDSGNTGNIVNSGYATSVYMTGLAYEQGRTATGCYNTGNIEFSGVTPGTLWALGLTYQTDSAMTDCYNTGNITLTGSTSTYVLSMFGEISGKLTGCYNKGNLTASNVSTKYANLCGLVYQTSGEIENCYNGEKGSTTKGVITFSGSAKSALNMGGIAYKATNNLTNVVNYAPINAAGSNGGSAYIGGIGRVGIAGGCTWTECVNYGDMTFSGIVGDANIEGSESGSDLYAGGIFSSSAGASEALASLVRCQNHGDMTFTETFNCSSAIRSAGCFARWEHVAPVLLEDCWNSGDITFNGTATTRSSGNYMIAGVFGYIGYGAPYVKGSIINSGNITLNGTHKKNSITITGGVFGRISANVGLGEGATEALIANTGSVSYTSSTTASFYAGGVLGDFLEKKNFEFAAGISLVNTGNVTVSGAVATAEDKLGYVGGIAGFVEKPIPSAQCYCTVNTVNATGITGAGMITGASYAAGACEVLAGGVGGTIIRDTIEDNDPSGDLIHIPNPQTITAENYHKYIYGAEVSAEVAALTPVLPEAPVVTLPAALPVTE